MSIHPSKMSLFSPLVLVPAVTNGQPSATTTDRYTPGPSPGGSQTQQPNGGGGNPSAFSDEWRQECSNGDEYDQFVGYELDDAFFGLQRNGRNDDGQYERCRFPTIDGPSCHVFWRDASGLIDKHSF